MKALFKSTMILALGFVAFTACEDDNDSNPTIAQPTKFVLNEPAITGNIDLEKTATIALDGEAFEYYEKAAGSGDATGMYNVAFMYENGYGVDADIEKAKKYYKMAADNGYSAGEIAFKRLNK